LRFTNGAAVLTLVFLVYLAAGARAQTSSTNLDSKDFIPSISHCVATGRRAESRHQNCREKLARLVS
jgi:hypothetical protein